MRKKKVDIVKCDVMKRKITKKMLNPRKSIINNTYTQRELKLLISMNLNAGIIFIVCLHIKLTSYLTLMTPAIDNVRLDVWRSNKYSLSSMRNAINDPAKMQPNVVSITLVSL